MLRGERQECWDSVTASKSAEYPFAKGEKGEKGRTQKKRSKGRAAGGVVTGKNRSGFRGKEVRGSSIGGGAEMVPCRYVGEKEL